MPTTLVRPEPSSRTAATVQPLFVSKDDVLDRSLTFHDLSLPVLFQFEKLFLDFNPARISG